MKKFAFHDMRGRHPFFLVLLAVFGCACGDDQTEPSDDTPSPDVIGDTATDADADVIEDGADGGDSQTDTSDLDPADREADLDEDGGGDIEDLNPSSERVEILWDSGGTPHIYAQTVPGVQYGHGYAQAADHLERMLVNFVLAEGLLSTLFPEDDPTLIEAGYGSRAPLAWDLLARQFRFRAAVDEHWGDLDAMDPAGWEFSTSEVVEAFARGINDYMDDHPETVPTWWSGEVEPQTVVAWSRVPLLFFQIELVLGKMEGRVEDGSDGTGSNGWVIGSDRTQDGAVVVHSDPHQPWSGPTVWYEVNLHAGPLDVGGATMFGLPFPPFLHNPDLATALTSNGADNADVFKVTVSPDDPDAYLLDGEPRPFRYETVQLTQVNGSVETLQIAWTHQGPVMHPENTVDFSETEHIYVAAATLLEQVNIITQLAAMDLSRNLAEFETAMAMLQIQRFNVMVGTADGHIFYLNNSRHPDRAEGANYRRITVVTTSEEDWTTRDVWSYDQLQTLTDPAAGYVQNCNNSPEWTVATGDAFDPDLWPEDYMKRDSMNPRAAFALEALSESTSLSFEEIEVLATSTESVQARWFVEMLTRAWGSWEADGRLTDRVATEAAITRLSTWDGYRADATSVEMPLYYQWLVRARQRIDTMRQPESDWGELEALGALNLLANSWRRLERDWDRTDITWGEMNQMMRGETAYPVSAAPSIVGTSRIMNVEYREDGVGYGVSGSSYTREVRLSPGAAPHIVSSKPFGNSELSDSIHFSDTTEEFVDGVLRWVPWERSDVEANLSSEHTIVTLEY
jgi:acyl-homoserine lactone acylase PvdQ